SMSTVPMVRCQRGSDVSIEYCTFIGRVASTASMSKRAIGHNSNISTNPTVLRVNNSYIDGFLGGIEFNGTLGGTDEFVVTNSRINTYGNGGSISEDNSIISFTNCNAIICNNTLTGTSSTYSTSCALFVKNTMVSNTNTAIVAHGNSGSISGNTSAPFFHDARVTQTSSIKKSFNNTWGSVTTDPETNTH